MWRNSVFSSVMLHVSITNNNIICERGESLSFLKQVIFNLLWKESQSSTKQCFPGSLAQLWNTTVREDSVGLYLKIKVFIKAADIKKSLFFFPHQKVVLSVVLFFSSPKTSVTPLSDRINICEVLGCDYLFLFSVFLNNSLNFQSGVFQREKLCCDQQELFNGRYYLLHVKEKLLQKKD